MADHDCRTDRVSTEYQVTGHVNQGEGKEKSIRELLKHAELGIRLSEFTC